MRKHGKMAIRMTYEVVMPYHLHMPSYFLGTFTEYPFVEEAAGVELFIASQGGVSFLLDAEGQKLFVCADKAELPAKFVHLLK